MKKSGGSKVVKKSERYSGRGMGGSGDGNMAYLSKNDSPNKRDEGKVKSQKYKQSRYAQ